MCVRVEVARSCPRATCIAPRFYSFTHSFPNCLVTHLTPNPKSPPLPSTFSNLSLSLSTFSIPRPSTSTRNPSDAVASTVMCIASGEACAGETLGVGKVRVNEGEEGER